MTTASDARREPRPRRAGLLSRLVLAAAAGLLAGVSSFVFLEVLDRVTSTRARHPSLVLLLPVAGLVLGIVASRVGRATEGNSLVMAEVRAPKERLPWTMAPFALIGAWATHLFGGSAGREGIALQMSASLADQLPRLRPLDERDRRVLLVAALAGGFGAVFGVPVAGTVFALEVQHLGRSRVRAVLPALVAAFVGDATVRALGHDHVARLALHPGLRPGMLLRYLVAGLAFGAAGAAFVVATRLVRRSVARVAPRAPVRPALGGLAVVGLWGLAGADYLGLSLPLLDRALGGEPLGFAVFALKLVLTAVTIGTGFPGGEVTPLFVIGSTLGAALAAPLGVDPRVLAALGLAGVFAAAARTPLACTVLAVELFGRGLALPALVACVAARAAAAAFGEDGIYRAHEPATAGVSGVRRARRGGRGAAPRWPHRGS